MNREAKKCRQCGATIYFDGLCVHCRAEKERNEILFLSQAEIDARIAQICAEIKETGKIKENRDLFTKLVNYRDIDTTQIAEVAFEKGIFHPCEIYKNAPDSVVKAMIDMLMKDDTEIANNLLLCLAAHGGDEVFHAFLELEKNPRAWRKKLYTDPSVYATYGGWSYDKDGVFLETNFDTCYPMVKGTLEEKEHSPVKIGTKTDAKCSRCGCQIVNLMEIDGRDPRLAYLGIGGKVKARCCPNCFAFSDGDFCRYTEDGESEFVMGENTCQEDYLGDSGVEELSSNTYVLGDTPVPLRYAADWEGGSSVGGFSFWIQDCEIKHCPDCGKPMKYLAQIQWDTVLDGMEGNAYIEICKDCKVMVVLHQQT